MQQSLYQIYICFPFVFLGKGAIPLTAFCISKMISFAIARGKYSDLKLIRFLIRAHSGNIDLNLDPVFKVCMWSIHGFLLPVTD